MVKFEVVTKWTGRFALLAGTRLRPAGRQEARADISFVEHCAFVAVQLSRARASRRTAQVACTWWSSFWRSFRSVEFHIAGPRRNTIEVRRAQDVQECTPKRRLLVEVGEGVSGHVRQ